MSRLDQTDWQKLRADWSAWWDGKLDRPLFWIQYEDPDVDKPGPADLGFLPNHPEMTSGQILDNLEQRLASARWAGDAVPCWWPNLGAGVVSAFLGARLHARPETVWFAPADPNAAQADLTEMSLQLDEDNPWWKMLVELTSAAAERFAGRLAVGHTDMGGNLDILASLRTTEQLLFDLYDHPDEVERLAGQMTNIWRDIYDRLAKLVAPAGMGTSCWAPIWSPKRCYMIQSDFSYMISPEMFQRFVLPDLQTCSAELDHSFYHLDGIGELAHLDTLVQIESLDGIQWVAGDGQKPPSTWFDVQGRIRQAGKLVQTWATRAEAIELIKNVGPTGLMIMIVDCHSDQQAQEFLAKAERLCRKA